MFSQVIFFLNFFSGFSLHIPQSSLISCHISSNLSVSLYFSYLIFFSLFFYSKVPPFFLSVGLEIEKWDFIFGSKCGDLKIRDFWDWYFGCGFGVWLFLWGFSDVGLVFVMAVCCVLC